MKCECGIEHVGGFGDQEAHDKRMVELTLEAKKRGRIKTIGVYVVVLMLGGMWMSVRLFGLIVDLTLRWKVDWIVRHALGCAAFAIRVGLILLFLAVQMLRRNVFWLIYATLFMFWICTTLFFWVFGSD